MWFSKSHHLVCFSPPFLCVKNSCRFDFNDNRFEWICSVLFYLLLPVLYLMREHHCPGKHLLLISSQAFDSFLSFFFDWIGMTKLCFDTLSFLVEKAFHFFYMDSPPCPKECIFSPIWISFFVWGPHKPLRKLRQHKTQFSSICKQIFAFTDPNNSMMSRKWSGYYSRVLY